MEILWGIVVQRGTSEYSHKMVLKAVSKIFSIVFGFERGIEKYNSEGAAVAGFVRWCIHCLNVNFSLNTHQYQYQYQYQHQYQYQYRPIPIPIPIPISTKTNTHQYQHQPIPIPTNTNTHQYQYQPIPILPILIGIGTGSIGIVTCLDLPLFSSG